MRAHTSGKAFQMGKGKRLKQQRRNNVGSAKTSGSAAGTARVEDPHQALDALASQLAANFLMRYLHLSLDLGMLDPTGDADLPEPKPGEEAIRARLAEAKRALDAQIGDTRITRHAGFAATVLGSIHSSLHIPVVRKMFTEAAGWLTESGYVPDYGLWFAGAVSYLRPMVPAQHEQQALKLLDWDRLRTDTAALQKLARHQAQVAAAAGDTSPPQMITEFSLHDPDGAMWLYDAAECDPAAMLHSAAALVTWLYAEPGAVVDPPAKGLALSERVLAAAGQR